jgi:hypothetical protein
VNGPETNSLRLTYSFSNDPEDDFGCLGVKVITECFTAENGWWVQWQDVEDFAEQLGRLTTNQSSPVEFSAGYKAPDRDWADVFHIALTPLGRDSSVDVFVRLMDQNRSSHRCETGFRTTLRAIEFFQRDVAALMRKERNDAELIGTDAPLDRF